MFGKIAKSVAVVFILGVSLTLSLASSGVTQGQRKNRWYSFTASFGKNSSNTIIDQNKIDKFIRDEIMTVLDGFKIVGTMGVWKGKTEDSFDVVVLDKNLKDTKKKLEKISLKYKAKFLQDSVLLFYNEAAVYFL